MFVPVGVLPLPFVAAVPIPPNGVPESKPLPVGSGGGCSFARFWGGGVGAFEEGPALPTSTFAVATIGLGSISISSGALMIGGCGTAVDERWGTAAEEVECCGARYELDVAFAMLRLGDTGAEVAEVEGAKRGGCCGWWLPAEGEYDGFDTRLLTSPRIGSNT